ncbi:Lipid-A-disaccharide synthase [Porphyridium purpureum]|uniref:lipid-A-disaccharide synthase n=1 Tax=Porphyridium purpureum TaxID=35688 RepID=A0A5J4Z0H7_PORPP|nr:Lipid-A-disaccharide synthase [Porphyridium purpureum]|eukprot:POR1913..scf208_2
MKLLHVLRLYVVAGEASGDRLAARAVTSLAALAREHGVRVEVHGVGGPAMRVSAAAADVIASGTEGASEAGAARSSFRSLLDLSRLSVMGIGHVLLAAPRLWYMQRQVVKDIERIRPHVVLFVDFKAFNKRVAKRVQHMRRFKEGSPRTALLQYVAPSIWAWRSSRAGSLRYASLFDEIMLLFPFERRAWNAFGIAHAFLVGSPAVEVMLDARLWTALKRVSQIRQNQREQTGSHIVLMPGSRPDELHHCMPVLTAALKRIAASCTGYTRVASVTCIVAESVAELFSTTHLSRLVDSLTGSSVTVNVHVNTQAPESSRRIPENLKILASSDLAIVTSGTAVLEAALGSTPTVCVYLTDWLTSLIAKRRAQVTCASIPNLILNRTAIPELLFEQCTEDRVAQSACDLLRDEASRKKQLHDVAIALRWLRREHCRHYGGEVPSALVAQRILYHYNKVERR